MKRAACTGKGVYQAILDGGDLKNAMANYISYLAVGITPQDGTDQQSAASCPTFDLNEARLETIRNSISSDSSCVNIDDPGAANGTTTTMSPAPSTTPATTTAMSPAPSTTPATSTTPAVPSQTCPPLAECEAERGEWAWTCSHPGLRIDARCIDTAGEAAGDNTDSSSHGARRMLKVGGVCVIIGHVRRRGGHTRTVPSVLSGVGLLAVLTSWMWLEMNCLL